MTTTQSSERVVDFASFDPVPSRVQRSRILLVADDDWDADQIARRLVEASCFDVSVAATASAAVSVAGTAGIDAIILDLDLPGGRGIDTLRRLTCSAPGIPVIALCPAIDDELGRDATSLGAWEVVAKVEATSRLFSRSVLHAVECQRAREQRRRLEEANARLAQHNRELVLAAASIEAANRELDSFSFSVAHDLRAPIRAIDACGVALVDRLGASIDVESRARLDRICDATGRMAHVVDDLLRLARVSLRDLHRSCVDLSRIANMVKLELVSGDASRDVEFAIEPKLSVDGDDRLLRILLTNLLSNAWKFTSTTRQPRIEVGRTTVHGDDAYFVRDNGVGFDPAHAVQLFGAFQRLHSESEFEGTGIGLSIVHRVVAQHGGTVWARGAIGEGATFYFTLEPRG